MIIYVAQIRTTTNDPKVDNMWRNHRAFTYNDRNSLLSDTEIEEIKMQVEDEMYKACGDLSYLFLYRIGHLTDEGKVRWVYTEMENDNDNENGEED